MADDSHQNLFPYHAQVVYESDKALFDIVAVHGLEGNLSQSCTETAEEYNHCGWLRNVLPRYFPSVRIMLFTYQRGFRGDTNFLTPNWLTCSARNLLNAVKEKLELENRPLAFISHSLGGLIVKKALFSDAEGSASVIKRAKRLVFFGTPHRCTDDTTSWEDLILNILFTTRSPFPLMRNVSTRVQNLAREFRQVSGEFNLMATPGLINMHQLEDKGNCQEVVVSKFSSTLGLVGEIVIGCQRPHRDLMDFNEDSAEVRAIAEAMKKDCNSSFSEVLSKLSSMSPPCTLPEEEPNSLIDSDQGDFHSWKDSSQSSILYFQTPEGKDDPGASVALFRRLQSEKKKNGVAYFKFDEQDQRSKSCISILSSILFQVLDQHPGRFGRVAELCSSMSKKGAWTCNSLQILFKSILSMASGSKEPLFLVINNCDPSLVGSLSFLGWVFRHQASSLIVKIALFSEGPSDTQHLVNYFGNSVGDAVPTTTKGRDLALVETLTAQILAKKPYLGEFRGRIQDILIRSENNAQLALTMGYLSSFDPAQLLTPNVLASWMAALPSDVETLVWNMLGNLPDWARHVLGWILHTQRPLRLNELAVVLSLFISTGSTAICESAQTPINSSAAITHALSPLIHVNNNEVSISHKMIRLCLLQKLQPTNQQAQAGAKGAVHSDQSDKMTEVSCVEENAPTGSNQEDAYSPNMAPEKVPSQARIPDDEIITFALLRYLSSSRLQEGADIETLLKKESIDGPQDPVLGLAHYAVSYWPTHCRIAEGRGCDMQQILGFLRDGSFIERWSELKSQLGGTDQPPEDISPTEPLHLASLLGFSGLVQKLEQKLEQDVSCHISIALASWGGHHSIVEHLLGRGRGQYLDEEAENLSLALIYASIRGHDEIVEILFRHIMKSHPSSLPWGQIICQAAELGFFKQLELFLENRPEYVDLTSEGSTALQLASKNGHVEVVSLLLEKGADPDSKEANDAMKPVLYASSGGHSRILKLLIDKGADVRVVSCTGQTPLHLAAPGNHRELAQMVLNRLEELKEMRNGHEETSSHQDMQRECPEETALDTDKTDETQSHGDEAQDDKNFPFVDHLHGVDTSDDQKVTPLMLASQKGALEVATLLLQRGATVDLLDEDSRSALYHAVVHGHNYIAELVLHHANSGTVFLDLPQVLIEAAKTSSTKLIDVCLGRDDEPSTQLTGHVDESGRTALHYASEKGNSGIVTLLISKGFEVDIQDKAGNTPLAVAALAGQVEMVSLLLDHGADATSRDSYQRNILSRIANIETSAFSTDHAKVIETLLEAKSDPNDHDEDDRSALHYAAWNGNWRAVEVMLRHRANPSDKGRWLWSTLHYAASYGSLKVMSLVLATQVDLTEADDEGLTAMHLAAWGNHDEAMEELWKRAPQMTEVAANDGKRPIHLAYNRHDSLKWLLDRPVDINARDNSGQTALIHLAKGDYEEHHAQLLLAHEPDLKAQDDMGKTALHYAASNDDEKLAQMLLNNDIDLISIKDSDNRSALDVAIHCGSHSFAMMLLEYRDTVDLGLNSQDISGNAALLLAVIARNDELVKKLLEIGVDTELRNKEGKTALLAAVSSDKVDMVRLLLAGGELSKANINNGGGLFPTAIHEAAKAGNSEMIEVLLELGANVDAEGGTYNTALTAATQGGYDNIALRLLETADATKSGGIFSNALSAAVFSFSSNLIPQLIDSGATVAAVDSQGRSSLHIAAWAGEEPIFKTLVDAADSCLLATDKQGRTVVHYAATSQSEEVMQWLLANLDAKNLNTADVDGWTPLHWACRSNRGSQVDLLIESQAQIATATKDGWTPENIAIFHEADDALERIETSNDLTTAAASTPDEKIPEEPKSWKVGMSHWGCMCDGCFQEPIYGIRWKCRQCPDFDFCFKCYWTAEETHPGHDFDRKGDGPEKSPEYECDVESAS